jgi:hypothetical protein
MMEGLAGRDLGATWARLSRDLVFLTVSVGDEPSLENVGLPAGTPKDRGHASLSESSSDGFTRLRSWVRVPQRPPKIFSSSDAGVADVSLDSGLLLLTQWKRSW